MVNSSQDNSSVKWYWNFIDDTVGLCNIPNLVMLQNHFWIPLQNLQYRDIVIL